MNKLSTIYLLSVVSVSLLSLLSGASGRCFNQEDLMEALVNGRCWIVVENEIYDLTNNPWWANGSHLKYSCGDIITISELDASTTKLEDLIDYYGVEEYAPKVGEFCQKRTTKKIESCGNGSCNPGENFISCPQDCPAGLIDGYCAAKWDFVCDPDCGRQEDPECICNQDNWCERGFENSSNCPNDCPPEFKDGFCYQRPDNFCDPDCRVEDDPDCSNQVVTSTSTLPRATTSLPYISTSTTLMPPGKRETNYLPQVVLAGIIITGIAFLLGRIRKERAGFRRREKTEDILTWLKKKLKEGEDPQILRAGLEKEGYDPALVDDAERMLWG